jgi:hypothetical protein
MKYATVVLFIVAAAQSANEGAAETRSRKRSGLRRILKQNQQQGIDEEPANNPVPQPTTNPEGNIFASNNSDGTAAPATTSIIVAVTSAPVPAPAPASPPSFVPVAVSTYAPMYIPKNCCEFLTRLIELDSACFLAVQDGKAAYMAMDLLEFSCEVPWKSIVALQFNYKVARMNYLSFLTPALQNLYPGVTQNCFATHFAGFSFACENRYIDEKTFKTKSEPQKSLDAIEDYLCCSGSQPPILDDAQPNPGQGDKSRRWCGGTTGATAATRCGP